MEGNDAPGKVNFRQVVEIVSSYVRHNTIAADDLPRVIADVYRALAGGEQPAPVQEPQRPAVPIHRSVGPEEVVCLECGHRARTLRRHLREAHGLSPDEYRARWGLAADHPLIAPGYSARRAAIAKASGFGRRRT
jgi:predicted transcriptional regulator